jgi:hypothetical protein
MLHFSAPAYECCSNTRHIREPFRLRFVQKHGTAVRKGWPLVPFAAYNRDRIPVLWQAFLRSLLRAVFANAKRVGRFRNAVIAVNVLRARVAAITSAEIALGDGTGVDGETAMALHGGTA